MGTLMQSNGYRPNGSFFPELPSIFDNLLKMDSFNRPALSNFDSSSIPAVNIKETEKSFELEVAAPGLNKKDFKIELENNRLIISAQKEVKEESKDEEGNYTRREFRSESFSRSFSLPEKLVDAEKIQAKYTEGILHISIPKAEETALKNTKLIKIS